MRLRELQIGAEIVDGSTLPQRIFAYSDGESEKPSPESDSLHFHEIVYEPLASCGQRNFSFLPILSSPVISIMNVMALRR